MRLAVRFLALAAVAACTGNHDVVGPFTGPTTRFAIDHVTLPTSNTTAERLADDLDGNGTLDNQLGQAFATLSPDSLTSHGDDMIGAGVIASSIELQATDLESAPRAGATYFGADGDAATTMGGEIVDGAFTSNRTRTTHVPGKATLVLPVFDDADPITVELDAMELDLAPDGSGGYNAVVRGGIATANALAAVGGGMLQMLANAPADHVALARLLDADRNGQVTPDEVLQSNIIMSFLAPDITLLGHPVLSLGFAAHLVPCPAGDCAARPSSTCFDRVRDGNETDVDCGGSCRPCATGAACAVAADCQAGACDSGVCPAPTCSDGVRDGLETDVDCGWNCGSTCASGKHCVDGGDCASRICDGTTSQCR